MVPAVPASMAAPPPPALSVTAIYEARLLIKLADLRTDQVVSPTAYRAGARLGTIGALGIVKPSTILVQAQGSTVGGQVSPARYVQIEQNGRRRREVRFPAARFVGRADPLTQLLRLALRPPAAPPCAGTLGFYDGRQAYDLTLTGDGAGNLVGDQARLGLVGPVKCRLTFRPVAGFSDKASRPNPFLRGGATATFARQGGGGPWVLSAVEVGTMLGVGRLTLTGLQAQGARPVFAPSPLAHDILKTRRRPR